MYSLKKGTQNTLQRRPSHATFRRYEQRSTPLAWGQLTHLSVASCHEGGPFIKIAPAKNSKTQGFTLESSHES